MADAFFFGLRHGEFMPPWALFIIGAVATTFVGLLFFAILRMRGLDPVTAVARLTAPSTTATATAAPTVS